jgi:iron complex outermembrane recepter protein
MSRQPDQTHKHLAVSFPFAIVAALLTTSGYAQDGSTHSASDQGALEEIVVTAQKRAQSIDDVGMTIQAFTGATLQERGVSDVQDLTRIVPGLTYAKGLLNSPVYTLRGVGFNDTSLAALPAVTVYVDQAPLIFPALTGQAGLDLERVEVLKGPQGTLFGENSTGGAINFVAAKPTDELHAAFDVSYGRFNSVETSGFVSGPITSTLKARIAIKLVDDGPWQQGYTVDRETGATRTQAGRLLLDWEPVETARIALNINAWHDNSDPQAGQFYALALQGPVGSPALLSYPVAPSNARSADTQPGFDPKIDETASQASLNAEFDLSGDVTLTSISSYVNYAQNNRVNASGMAIAALDLDPDNGAIHSFNQELRVAYSDHKNWRLVGGANYGLNTVYESTQEVYPYSTIGIFAPLNLVSSAFYSDQRMKSYAAFGNAEYDLTNRLTLNVGARYTNTETDFAGCNHDDGDGRAAAFFTGLASLLRGAPVTPVPPGGCIQLGPTFLPNHLFVDQLKENNTSWRAGVNYKATSAVLFYADAAKGYKAGGFPQLASSSDSQLAPIKQESVLDYEGGFKAQLLAHTLSVDGAVFYYTYNNKQIRGTVVDPVFGLLNELINIPESTLKGAELDLAWRPVAGLTTTVSGTYLNAKVTRFAGLDSAGVATNFAGTPLPLAPEWQFATAIDYEFPVSLNKTAFLGANTIYNSHTYGEVGGGTAATPTNPDPADYIKGYFVLDLRAGIRFADNKWTLSAWGKNVTNTYYWNNALLIYDQKVRYTGKPATYGVEMGYRF